MFLAFNLSDIVTVPFGYLMELLYRWTANYGAALILFAIAVKIIMIPINAKGKKSMMKMSRLTPRIQAIQKKYADDQVKQNQAISELYKEEGVAMSGGCLWSFVPILILFPLYSLVRQPLTYMLHLSAEESATIVKIIQDALPQLFESNSYYTQILAAPQIPNFVEAIKAALPNISESALAGINFNFLGIDLGAIPQFNVFAWDKYDWAHIGAFTIPMLSAGIQVLSTFIGQKLNDSVVTNKDGVKDTEAAKNSQSAQTTKVMMWTMPLMSLWIGFTVPAGLSLYWFIQGFISIIVDNLMTLHYRKVYDAEDAVRLQKALERDAIEAEKERVRAERRAANPDGITENTSKKKLQQKQRRDEEAQKAAAAREYAMSRGIDVELEQDKSCLSGIPSRPFCRGRNYDPNHYRSTNTEE
jgi:YidC/Oxa1 family membrane protein insertase